MRLRSKVALSAGVGILVGGTAFWANSAASPEESGGQSFEVNRHGKTVGDLQPGSEAPDLVPVRLEDGSTGFAHAEALMGGTDLMPANPEEAVAMMKAQQTRKTGVFEEAGRLYVLGYADDGETVIGRVLVGRTN